MYVCVCVCVSFFPDDRYLFVLLVLSHCAPTIRTHKTHNLLARRRRRRTGRCSTTTCVDCCVSVWSVFFFFFFFSPSLLPTCAHLFLFCHSICLPAGRLSILVFCFDRREVRWASAVRVGVCFSLRANDNLHIVRTTTTTTTPQRLGGSHQRRFCPASRCRDRRRRSMGRVRFCCVVACELVTVAQSWRFLARHRQPIAHANNASPTTLHSIQVL